MPTKLKTISVRLPEEQYAVISRLCELTGKSRNDFFREIMDGSTPALRQMLEVLDQADRYRNPGERVARVVSIGAEEAARVTALIRDGGDDTGEVH